MATPALAGPVGGSVVAIADFNNDGRSDIMVQDPSGLLFIFITAANGISIDNAASGSPTTLPAGFSVRAAVDFNADGNADILVENGSGLLFVFIMNSNGISINNAASGSPATIPAGFSFVSAADTTADGRAEVVVQNASGLLFTFVTAANGISFDNAASGSPGTIPAGFSVKTVGDYTGDGRADVMVQNASGLLFTFVTAANGISFDNAASGSPTTVPATFNYVGAGDYTADTSGAQADVVVERGSDALLFIYATGADGVSIDMGASGSPTTIPSGFTIVGIGDFNGDSRADTMVKNGSKLLFVFIHDGPATINMGNSGSPTTIPTSFDLPIFIGL